MSHYSSDTNGTMAQQLPASSMGRSASSSSLTGESSSAVIGGYGAGLGSNARGGLSAGVRGLSGAITMERSEHERLKYPDRINLDKKGLHSESKILVFIRFSQIGNIILFLERDLNFVLLLSQFWT